MGKSHIDISSIFLIVVLINFVTYVANARVHAGEGVATYIFTNFNERIKDSDPSPGGRGHGDPPPVPKFNSTNVKNFGPSPGEGHDEPPPAQRLNGSDIKYSGPSHGAKDIMNPLQLKISI